MLDAKGQRIVSNCRNLIETTIPKLMVGLFEQLDDSLYELANKSDNNTLQTSFFDAMRVLRKERVQIDRKFNSQLLHAYDEYWETGEVYTARRSLDQLSRDSDMALLDNEELEDSLAITNMISKSENRYSKERYALSQRFSYLVKGNLQQISHELSPLDPIVICNAFQTAMKEVAVELPVKLVVYKLFEKHFIHYLGGLYDEINLLLGKAGIIPNLTPKVRRNPVAPAMHSGSSREAERASLDSRLTTDSMGVGVAPGSEMGSIQGEVFATLQQLLGLRRLNSNESMLASSMMISGSAGVSLPAVETGELLGALSALQQSNILILPQAGGQTVSPKVLKAQLAEDLRMRDGGELSRTLGDADNDTIDVITMLFEFILDDFSLPDAMKALLSRLQIPMLKVAIIDKTFFSKNRHPARRLLNSLATGSCWLER